MAQESNSVIGGPEPLPLPQLLLRALATRFVDGEVVAAPLLTEALRRYRSQPQQLDALCHPYYFVAAELWDDEAWFELTSGQLQLARSTGTLSWLSVAMGWLALFHVQAGEFAQAEALILEQETIEPGITEPTPFYGTLMLAAWRADAPLATELIEQMIVSASARGEGLALTYAEYMKAVLYNGLAQYDLAAEAAHNANSGPASFIVHWALPELVEAAVRTNQHERAAAACERLSAIAAATGTNWARGAAAHARAHLTDGDAADDLYREAIALQRRTRMAAHLMRTRLCYGEWLRRTKHRAEAGSELRQAFDGFSAMGANGFAERARRELQATGGRVRKDRVTAGTGLTPQEEQVAQLARARRTSAEIGAELFLSARTVEWHLANIFTKLEIRSRRELDAALRRRGRMPLNQD